MKSPIQCKYSSTSTTFFSVVIFFTTVAVVAATDADYMSMLLKALTPTPSGWFNKTHFCEWNGVVCHRSSTLVHTISLPSSSLTGTLPQDISTHLSNLTNIDLHNNSLYGPLPDLYGLEYLKTVNLGHNNFTSIPNAWFMQQPSLETLNLSNNLNLIPWVFPNDLRSSSLLNTLDFQATNMIGSLPSEMLDWFPHLETLVLSHNNISGPLPDSLARSVVKCLKVNNQGIWNGFTDTIEVISSMKHLTQAWLNNNSFSGPIPDLSNSTHLFDLQLHSNNLRGVIPSSLMALSSLKNISLDDNIFRGPIPVFNNNVKATWEGNLFCRTDVGPCNPEVMNLLEIGNKAFGFPYPQWRGNNPCNGWYFIGCTKEGKIRSVDFGNFNVSGTISPAFANLTNLVNLTLSGNNFTGIIPDSLTTLSQLRFLDVSNNNLSGHVPIFSPKVKLNITGNVLLRLSDPVDNKTLPDDDNIKTEAQVGTSLKPLWIALIGASVFGIVVAILIVIIRKHKSYLSLVQKKIFKKTRILLDDNVEDFIKSYNLLVPKRYSYAEVKKITNSFRDKLGQGGFGVVYKGMLLDDRQVAVKLIKESKGDGEEFINEVASISRTLHVNIVALLGFCYEMNKRALIYEFMPNGSLDKFIYRSGFSSASCNLDWNTLNGIVIGTARGLEYLLAPRMYFKDLASRHQTTKHSFG